MESPRTFWSAGSRRHGRSSEKHGNRLVIAGKLLLFEVSSRIRHQHHHPHARTSWLFPCFFFLQLYLFIKFVISSAIGHWKVRRCLEFLTDQFGNLSELCCVLVQVAVNTGRGRILGGWRGFLFRSEGRVCPKNRRILPSRHQYERQQLVHARFVWLFLRKEARLSQCRGYLFFCTFCYSLFNFDMIEHYLRALESDSKNPLAVIWYGNFLVQRGHPEEMCNAFFNSPACQVYQTTSILVNSVNIIYFYFILNWE